MSFMEMLVVVMAAVLFATTAVLFNTTMVNQNDLLINANQYLQASHLSHSLLDEVDAKLFSKQLKFSQIKQTYTANRTINLAHTGGTYNVQMSATDCDSLGTPIQSADPNNIYIRVLVSTNTYGLTRPVIMQRVFTKTHLNT